MADKFIYRSAYVGYILYFILCVEKNSIIAYMQFFYDAFVFSYHWIMTPLGSSALLWSAKQVLHLISFQSVFIENDNGISLFLFAIIINGSSSSSLLYKDNIQKKNNF